MRASPLLQRCVALAIKHGLQKYGEGCDGRYVLAVLGDASRMKYFQCSSSAFFSED